MAYWRRTGESTFAPTEHVGGAWTLEEQHIAPALGLLVHAVEHDRDRRGRGGLVVSRLSYDILGTVPLAELELSVVVERPGRTIELVRAEARHGGRVAVVLRAWLLEPRETTAVAGSGLPPMPGPAELEPFDATTVWPGGFIASVEVRRRALGEGRALCWVRTPHDLVADEEVSSYAAVAGLLDITNGLAVRADPGVVAFPNVDLTAHLLRRPADGWLGLDITVSFGPGGVGITSSVVHDKEGALGTTAQSLTVRP